MTRTQQAVELVRAGHSHSDAARIVGINRTGVNIACKAAGIGGQTVAGRIAIAAAGFNNGNRCNRGKFDPVKRDRAHLIYQRWQKGETYGDIARAMGTTRSTIAGLVSRAKLALAVDDGCGTD